MTPTQTSCTNIFLREIPQTWYICINFDSPKNWVPCNDHLIKQTNFIKQLLLPLNLPTFQTGPSCPLRCPICCCRPSVTSQIRMVPSPVSVQRIHLRRRKQHDLDLMKVVENKFSQMVVFLWWFTMVESAKKSPWTKPSWVSDLGEFYQTIPKKGTILRWEHRPDDVKQLWRFPVTFCSQTRKKTPPLLKKGE